MRSFASAYASSDPVTVEMVGRHVQQHAHARTQLVDVLELEARELADDPAPLGELADETRDRVADVARDRDDGTPPACSIAPIRLVAVDLPFVPVMPIHGCPGPSSRKASSTSLQTGTPAARAAVTIGDVPGTPGLFTRRSTPSDERRVVADHPFDALRQRVRQGVSIDQAHRRRRVCAAQRRRRRDARPSRADDEHARSIEGAVGSHRPCFAPGGPPPAVRCTD